MTGSLSPVAGRLFPVLPSRPATGDGEPVNDGKTGDRRPGTGMRNREHG